MAIPGDYYHYEVYLASEYIESYHCRWQDADNNSYSHLFVKIQDKYIPACFSVKHINSNLCTTKCKTCLFYTFDYNQMIAKKDEYKQYFHDIDQIIYLNKHKSTVILNHLLIKSDHTNQIKEYALSINKDDIIPQVYTVLYLMHTDNKDKPAKIIKNIIDGNYRYLNDTELFKDCVKRATLLVKNISREMNEHEDYDNLTKVVDTIKSWNKLMSINKYELLSYYFCKEILSNVTELNVFHQENIHKVVTVNGISKTLCDLNIIPTAENIKSECTDCIFCNACINTNYKAYIERYNIDHDDNLEYLLKNKCAVIMATLTSICTHYEVDIKDKDLNDIVICSLKLLKHNFKNANNINEQIENIVNTYDTDIKLWFVNFKSRVDNDISSMFYKLIMTIHQYMVLCNNLLEHNMIDTPTNVSDKLMTIFGYN